MDELDRLRAEIAKVMKNYPLVAKIVKPSLDAQVECIDALDRRLSKLEEGNADGKN